MSSVRLTTKQVGSSRDSFKIAKAQNEVTMAQYLKIDFSCPKSPSKTQFTPKMKKKVIPRDFLIPYSLSIANIIILYIQR